MLGSHHGDSLSSSLLEILRGSAGASQTLVPKARSRGASEILCLGINYETDVD